MFGPWWSPEHLEIHGEEWGDLAFEFLLEDRFR